MQLQNVQHEFVELMSTENGESDLLMPAHHMMIYRNNKHSNLMQSLLDTYKMIMKLVGEDFFRVTANEYINNYPSLSGNLYDYGEYFSDFLAGYASVRSLPYLAEVAAFEWACHGLHFANDASALSIKSLESVAPDQFQQLRFILHPAIRLLQFQYPILRIIDLCQGEMDEEINVNEGGVNLLLKRPHHDILLLPISLAKFTFLTALSRNKNLGQALDETIDIDPDFKLDECLPKWIQDKTIVDFSLDANFE